MENISLDNFDFEEWEHMVKRYFANKEILNFKMNLFYHDGSINLRFSMSDDNKKYVPALERLIMDICRGAAFVMCKVFYADYAVKQDKEAENKKIFDFMQKETETYLQILFSKGLDSFLCVMQEQMLLFEALYTFEHTRYDVKAERWKTNGNDLTNGLISKSEGISYSKVNEILYTLLEGK